MKVVKASTDNIKLRIANCGESNSGKSYSAMLMANIINGGMNGVTIIDTENRGELYGRIFPGVDLLKLDPPFDPEKLIEALEVCAKKGDKFVIVDSASDFWDRVRQIHTDMVGTNLKMNFPCWGKVGPRWDNLRNAIRNAPFHIVTCWRMKDKMEMKNGEIIAAGQRVVARGGSKGIKYDYMLAFIIDENHKARVGKDNLHLFADWKEPAVIDEAVALKIKDWITNKPKGVENVRSKQSDSVGPAGARP
jgi:hypothetical protein